MRNARKFSKTLNDGASGFIAIPAAKIRSASGASPSKVALMIESTGDFSHVSYIATRIIDAENPITSPKIQVATGSSAAGSGTHHVALVTSDNFAVAPAILVNLTNSSGGPMTIDVYVCGN